MNYHAVPTSRDEVSRHTRGNGYPESKQSGFPIGESGMTDIRNRPIIKFKKDMS